MVMVVAQAKKDIYIKDTQPSDYHDSSNENLSEYELNLLSLKEGKEIAPEVIYKDKQEFTIFNYKRKFKMSDFKFFIKESKYTQINFDDVFKRIRCI